MASAVLHNRSRISLFGDECEHFLENLITCQVQSLKPGEARYGSLLTPQGKVMFDFFLIRTANGFTLETSADSASELAKRLTFYRLRAKVEISEPEAIAVQVDWEDTNEGFADPRHKDMGRRLHGNPDQEGERLAYDLRRVELGVPEAGFDFALGNVWPHDILMDANGGVDFSKGCFVGQEVVSRMRHRGTARNRVVMVKTMDSSPLPITGTPVEADGRECGKLGTVVDDRGLALLRTDRAAKADKLTIDNAAVLISAPQWAGFSLDKREDTA